MANSNQATTDFLMQLHTFSEGNNDSQVSMYVIGEQIGLDRDKTSQLSQELMIDEYIELVTLSGSITITENGLRYLAEAGLIAGSPNSPQLALSEGPVVNDDDRSVIETIINTIRSQQYMTNTSFEQLEELVIDLKTIEVQLLSPRPKSAVVRELLRSIEPNLANAGDDTTRNTLLGVL